MFLLRLMDSLGKGPSPRGGGKAVRYLEELFRGSAGDVGLELLGKTVLFSAAQTAS
jgi:hypothetical protein